MAKTSNTIDLKAVKAASEQATNYLSIDNTGIMVADMTNGTQTPSGITSGNNVFVDSSSVNIRDGQDVLANFKANEINIGNQSEIYMKMSNRMLTLQNNDEKIMEMGSLGDSSGLTYIRWTVAKNLTVTNLHYHLFQFVRATYEDEVDATNDITVSEDGFTITIANRRDKMLNILYYTDDPTPIYTLGSRISGSRGINSLTVGRLNLASGENSVAFGEDNKIISGPRTFAVGHNNTVSADDAQAMGDFCAATAKQAHAHGEGTIAASVCQTAIGKYNEEDSGDNNVFIIGNGTGKNARSNAFMVDWNGNVSAFGGIYIPANKTISLANDSNYTTLPSTENGKNGIHASEYGGAMNNYYMSQGYHAFYAGGSGKMYIYDDRAQVNGAFNATGTITQNGTAVSLSTHTHVPNIKWKAGSYKTASLASGYTDVTSNVTFPNLSGYTKCVLVIGTNSAYTGVTGAYVDSNNYIHFRCRNFATAASTPIISFFMIYLKDSCKWS